MFIKPLFINDCLCLSSRYGFEYKPLSSVLVNASGTCFAALPSRMDYNLQGSCIRLQGRTIQLSVQVTLNPLDTTVFTPLNLFHILLCYSLNLKSIEFNFFVTDPHKIPQKEKVQTCFNKFLQINLKRKAEISCVKTYSNPRVNT